jgi:YVTN family beta-propeller protein
VCADVIAGFDLGSVSSRSASAPQVSIFHFGFLLSFCHSMFFPKNYRAYFIFSILFVFGAIVLLREHRPSFLRPNLHMYAYVSTADGELTVVDLAKLQAIAKIPVGAAVSDLREQAKREEIWGVSNVGGYVFVVETATNQVTRIAVGPSPYSLDFSPSGDRIYTTTAGLDQLVAIDTASRQVYGRAHTKGEPIQARLTPDAKNIVVVNRRAGMVSIHDARTLQLLDSVRVIPQPDEVVITPDSALAFVMSRTQNRLSVVDLERAVLVTNLELAGTPTQILLKPDGGELYAISPDAHGLQAIDTWTHEVGDTMILGSAPTYAIINSDISEMYVADHAASRVVAVDINNRRILGRPIPVGASPSFMRFSPTDQGALSPMLLVADEGSDDLAVIRTRTDSLITLIPVGPHPERVAVKIF